MATNRAFDTKRDSDITKNLISTTTTSNNNFNRKNSNIGNIRTNTNTNNKGNENNSLFSKTLFIEGCDCGVINDKTQKTEYEDIIERKEDTIGGEFDDDGDYLKLTYQTLKFNTSYDNQKNFKNNDNNNDNFNRHSDNDNVSNFYSTTTLSTHL